MLNNVTSLYSCKSLGLDEEVPYKKDSGGGGGGVHRTF